MKTIQAVNFWSKEPVKVPVFNINGFHRVDFQNDDLIIGFFEYGNRTAETLTAGDIDFLTSYFCKFIDAELAYDIVGRDAVRSNLPNMRDTFLRIRKVKNKRL
jgi:hypothetical protein